MLMRTTFGIVDLSEDFRSMNQRRVGDTLRNLARSFESDCGYQESARKGTDTESLKRANRWVAISKKKFWDAHALAKGADFSVRDTLKEYLTNS